jgi:poly(A) polymerase
MLNRVPKDYDISTAATPEQIRDVFGRRIARIIGKRFRLVHLHYGRGIIEISTFRTAPQNTPVLQKKIKDKNLPENLILHDNEFGTAEEDAWRRDFTVNALFYDPLTQQILDYTGTGIQDIYDGTVRAIGDPHLRFEEDPVRLLRALKLVGQYDFKLEHGTAAALRQSLPLIEHAVQSRLTLELEKILTGNYGEKILTTFHHYGFLRYFLPYLDLHWGSPAVKYLMELLRERNHRVLKQKYRGSISLAVALITLPFIEDLFGFGKPGGLWDIQSVKNAQISHVMELVFKPHHLIKQVTYTAYDIVELQPLIMAKRDDMDSLSSCHSYHHARELFLIQNSLLWHLPEIQDTKLSDTRPRSRPPFKSRKRRPRVKPDNTAAGV